MAPAIFNRPSGTARSGPLIYRVAYEPAAAADAAAVRDSRAADAAQVLLAPGRPAELANVIVEDNAVLRELRTAKPSDKPLLVTGDRLEGVASTGRKARSW